MDGLWWLTSCIKMKHNLGARNPVLASREFTETCRVTSFSPICVEPPATTKLDEAEKKTSVGLTNTHTHETTGTLQTRASSPQKNIHRALEQNGTKTKASPLDETRVNDP